MVTKNPNALISEGTDSLCNKKELIDPNNTDGQMVEVSSLDYPGIASMMTQQLGALVSEHTMKFIISQNVMKEQNLSGRTMVLLQNEDSLTNNNRTYC
jgi:hypothetical protein